MEISDPIFSFAKAQIKYLIKLKQYYMLFFLDKLIIEIPFFLDLFLNIYNSFASY